ncbi:MAG: polysaccharide deacetylase family protein [Burkholderiales bacterium]
MPRHIVCLTFDFDALSPWIARGMTSPTPVSRGEFGIVGARRLLALMARHQIKTSWFIPGHTIETYPDACAQVVEAGHEIGHHGWTHVPPANMTRVEEEEGLVRANEQIKKLSGRYARGYRSPSWDLSAHSVELLLKHGFFYDSSMMGDDYTPYRVRQGDVIELLKPAVFGPATRLVEMPISWSLDDYPHFEYVRMGTAIAPGLMNASDVLENWIDDFLYMKRNLDWGIITYTCHPFVIGRGHRMLMLERLIERLASEGAEFMTMEAAAGLFDARSPHNPQK